MSVLLLYHYRSNLPPPKARCCETKDEWVTAQVIQSTAKAFIQAAWYYAKHAFADTRGQMNPHLDAHCHGYTHIVDKMSEMSSFVILKKSAYEGGIKANHWPALEGRGKVSGLISLPNIRWERLVPWPFFTAGSFSRPWTPLNQATYAAWLNSPCWGPSALRCPNNPILKGTSVAFLSRPRLPTEPQCALIYSICCSKVNRQHNRVQAYFLLEGFVLMQEAEVVLWASCLLLSAVFRCSILWFWYNWINQDGEKHASAQNAHG